MFRGGTEKTLISITVNIPAPQVSVFGFNEGPFYGDIDAPPASPKSESLRRDLLILDSLGIRSIQIGREPL